MWKEPGASHSLWLPSRDALSRCRSLRGHNSPHLTFMGSVTLAEGFKAVFMRNPSLPTLRQAIAGLSRKKIVPTSQWPQPSGLCQAGTEARCHSDTCRSGSSRPADLALSLSFTFSPPAGPEGESLGYLRPTHFCPTPQPDAHSTANFMGFSCLSVLSTHHPCRRQRDPLTVYQLNVCILKIFF